MNFYNAILIVSLVALAILSTFVIKSNLLTKKMKRTFITIIMLIAAATTCEWAGLVLDGNAELKVLHLIVKFLELSIAPFIAIVFGLSLLDSKFKKGYFIILIAHGVLQFTSIFWNVTFYIDDNGYYHHGNFYFVYYIMLVIGIAYLFYAMIKVNMNYQSSNKMSLFLIILFLLFGTIIQMINNEARVVWLVIVISCILFYIYYISLLIRIDDLTGLLNRLAFDMFTQSIKKAKGVLFFDVNQFKKVNDDYGHQYGDKTLKTIAIAIKKVYAKYGYCYRVGGDEFCVILMKGVEEVEKLRLDFLNNLAKERLSDKNLPDVAVGFSEYDSSKMTITEAITKADQNMYFDKNKN